MNSQIAKLRNTSFTKSKFTNLKFNIHPEPNKDRSEGYNFEPTPISFPIIGADPNNVYNNICYGHSEPITMNFAAYDKKLHRLYKEYYQDCEYSQADVFKCWWGYPEILCVDFKESLIESTQMDGIHFHSTLLSYTVFKNVIFNNMTFVRSTISNSIFEDCTFNKCTFMKIKFTDSQFVNCVFNNSSYNSCNKLDIKITHSQFNKINFNNSTIPIKTTKMFEKCTFHDVNITFCNDESGLMLFKEDFERYIKTSE